MPKEEKASNQLGLFLPETEEWTRPKFLPDWRSAKRIAIDFETKDDGLNKGKGPGWAFANHGYINGMSICNGEKSLYFPIRSPDTDNFDVDAVHRWLKEHVTKPSIECIFHHAPYDTGWILREVGVSVANCSDSLIQGVMINEQRRSYSLDNLCKLHGLPGKDKGLLHEAARALGIHPYKEMYKLPARYVGAYAEGDTSSTWALFHLQEEEIKKQELEQAYRLECDLVEVTMKMRMRGIRIDHDRLELLRAEYFEKRDKYLDQISDGYGTRISMEHINSSKKLAPIFDSYSIDYPFTKEGAPSFKSDWLETHQHWLPKTVDLIKKYDSAADKFLTNYIEGSIVDGRLHAEIHQLRDNDEKSTYGGGTKSYRFSLSNPPLQQMPARDEDMKLIREVFLPEEGDEWCVGDYSQQEPRLTVHYASRLGIRGSQKAVEYYTNNPDADYHQMVADITGLDRNKVAKPMNLGLAYGMGLAKLARKLNKSMEGAEEVLGIYHENLPYLKDLQRICTSKARESGFIKLIDGARCRFELWRPKEEWFGPAYEWEQAKKQWPDAVLARADVKDAMNRLIQGSAARQTKKAMLDCFRAGMLPMIQMHDDLNFSISDRKQAEDITRMMNEAIPLLVPMKVDIEIGPSWGGAVKVS